MKLRNPQNRYDIDIRKSARVLEVGGGHNPHPRSNVVVDKYSGSENLHRGLDLKILPNQKFINADGEALPFKDNEFDYVICNHVLEHVDNPANFLLEQCRVAKKGYLETPSLIGEYLVPKASHRWVILEIDKQIVLYEKERINFSPFLDLGYIFNEYLPKQSLPFKLLQRTQPNLITVNYEWEEGIDFLVNPNDDYYVNFFVRTWGEDFCKHIFAQRPLLKEGSVTWNAFIKICRSVLKGRLFR